MVPPPERAETPTLLRWIRNLALIFNVGLSAFYIMLCPTPPTRFPYHFVWMIVGGYWLVVAMLVRRWTTMTIIDVAIVAFLQAYMVWAIIPIEPGWWQKH
jgi:hypothetical protein